MKDPIGDRMKSNYETITKTRLVRRMPVIIRIDGKAFHTYTKGFEKPFDTKIVGAMQVATNYLCNNVQGCVLGYTQSDEISLLLIDYKKFDTSAWFDNEIQKIVSIAASMATMKFNQMIEEKPCAIFDARAFNIPKEEVCNYFVWRQRDGIRNAINSMAQSKFPHKQLQGKSTKEVEEMLYEVGYDYNNLDEDLRIGQSYIKFDEGWKARCLHFSTCRELIEDLLRPEQE